MKTFTINHLERLCGTKKHTIRIWEKRYDLLHPNRNINSYRHYCIDDVERIMYVSFLIRRGMKVSQISTLNNIELKELSWKLRDSASLCRFITIQLVTHYYRSEIEQFQLLLDKSIKEVGFEESVDNLIVPFLYITSLVEYRENAPEVHFAVTTIRQKLLVAIDQTVAAQNNTKKAVLFLPEDEHFDLILLFVYYTLKSGGYTVYYLGTNVSEKSLEKVLISKQPDKVLTYSSPAKSNNFVNIALFINNHFPHLDFTIVSSTSPVNTGVSRVNYTHFLELRQKQLNFV
ncbi:MAG TPA: MerR family transcriptional regulator [Flavitalea sp.]|nr:MerR family transcriptional regulator [Flavitalea sp.]